MELFQMKNSVLSFSPQALAIKDFETLWKRDKTKNKEKAVAELSYVWYMEDITSPFFSIVDEQERSKEIIAVLTHLPNTWKPDVKVKAAMIQYKKLNKSIAEEMLRNTIKLIVKINDFIAQIDPAETYKDKSGYLQFKYDFKKILDTAKQVPDVLKALRTTRELALKERQEDSGIRGSLEKTVFEDGA